MAVAQTGRSLGWALSLMGLTAACGGSSPSGLVWTDLQATTPVSVTESVQIPMPIQTLRLGSSSLRLLGMPVAVGSESSQLLLDTGSAGLRIFAEAASGITRTGIPSRAEFGDGTVYEGELALASVLIGPVAIEEPILIQVVDRVGCVLEAPDCPGRDGPQVLTDAGLSGILGISLGARTPALDLYSPLTRLPGNLDTGYVIETRGSGVVFGTFTLGLTRETQQGFIQAKLSQTGSDSFSPLQFPDGTPAWDDAQIRPFYTITSPGQTTLLSEVPARTLFDTGSSDISLEVFSPTPTTQILPTGSQFRAYFPALFRFEFTVGAPITPSLDRVYLDRVPDPQLQILGMPFFFRYDTLFDIERGRIGFRQR